MKNIFPIVKHKNETDISWKQYVETNANMYVRQVL